jgi:hypothetical protein
VYTADKSDVEIITPLLRSERKSLGPVAELGRSYKGTLLSLTLFLTARWNCRWRPESVVLGWFQVHVDLHIVSTEAALVKKILNAKACNALLIHPHAGNRGCPGRRKRKVESPAVAISYCAFMDWESAIRLCGSTRMMPPRGLSMSAMSKTAIDTSIGTTSSRSAPLQRSL